MNPQMYTKMLYWGSCRWCTQHFTRTLRDLPNACMQLASLTRDRSWGGTLFHCEAFWKTCHKSICQKCAWPSHGLRNICSNCRWDQSNSSEISGQSSTLNLRAFWAFKSISSPFHKTSQGCESLPSHEPRSYRDINVCPGKCEIQFLSFFPCFLQSVSMPMYWFQWHSQVLELLPKETGIIYRAANTLDVNTQQLGI